MQAHIHTHTPQTQTHIHTHTHTKHIHHCKHELLIHCLLHNWQKINKNWAYCCDFVLILSIHAVETCVTTSPVLGSTLAYGHFVSVLNFSFYFMPVKTNKQTWCYGTAVNLACRYLFSSLTLSFLTQYSLLVRALDSWSKGCEFQSWQKRCENFILQSQLCVLTLIWCPFHPRITAAAHKMPQSFCQKCRWQVTPKHYTHLWPNEVRVGWLCCCPGTVWEPIRNELTRNSSGNTGSQLSQLAEPLWNILPKSSHVRKNPPPPPPPWSRRHLPLCVSLWGKLHMVGILRLVI